MGWKSKKKKKKEKKVVPVAIRQKMRYRAGIVVAPDIVWVECCPSVTGLLVRLWSAALEYQPNGKCTGFRL